jgi:cell division cycle 20-like protein 1 (cofactor of APC complex)
LTQLDFITSQQRSQGRGEVSVSDVVFKNKRKISQYPFRVLDAPSLCDDFYLNLVDWSQQNALAVALGQSVYIWNANTSHVTQLVDLGPRNQVTSVSWSQKGNHLSIGTLEGSVQIWDVQH